MKIADGIRNVVPEPLSGALSILLEDLRRSTFISRHQLIAIAREKNGGKLSRSKTLAALESNSEMAVKSLTRTAFAHEDPEVQMRTLLGLDGVRVPTVSCVLTWREPERFAVIDTRAATAIEKLTDSRINPQKVGDWLIYLRAVRFVAKQLNESCMEVDRRLYTLGRSIAVAAH